MSGRKDLPVLFRALPLWHPGAWGPPAETISWASLAVGLLGIYRLLFHDEYVKALFKFQFNALWVSLPALIVAVAIVWAGSKRPGGNWPRLYALGLAVFCFAVVLWALFANTRPERANATAPWDDPRLHALSAVGFMAVLALTPRFFHVHPYSRWVYQSAPAALAVVSAVCLLSASWAETTVIDKEQQRLQEKIDLAKGNAQKIYAFLHPAPSKGTEESADDPVTDLKGLSFTGNGTAGLPTAYDWPRLRLLHRDEEMHKAMSDCLETITEAILNPRLPRLSVMKKSGNEWLPNPAFADEARQAAAYYRELARLHEELRTSFLGSSFSAEYAKSEQALKTLREDYAGQFNQQWVSALMFPAKHRSPLDNLLKSRVGSLGFNLGDFNQWRNLPWQTAKSTVEVDNVACIPMHGKQWQEEIDDPAAASSSGTGSALSAPEGGSSSPGTVRHKITLTHAPKHIECYAYRPTPDLGKLEMFAELDLSYELTQKASDPWQLASRSLILLLYVPSEAEPARYREEIVNKLASSRLTPAEMPVQRHDMKAFPVKLSSP